MAGGTFAIQQHSGMLAEHTYNYGSIYRRPNVFGKDGIRSIYGKTGAESIPVLEKAIAGLNNDTDPNYWKGRIKLS